MSLLIIVFAFMAKVTRTGIIKQCLTVTLTIITFAGEAKSNS